MKVTVYKDVNNLLDELLKNMKLILNEKLVGLYLEGSLVLGDFDPKISDVDLVAVLAADINEVKFEQLRKMHANFVAKHMAWNDRIEVCYISIAAINSSKTKQSSFVNISPGEPFHRTKTRKEWLMNWYLTREKSVILYGPSPKTILDPISKEEFIQSVKDHTKSWRDWVNNMRNPYAQSYAILTMCRALYAYKNGDQVSKKKAALWAKEKLPEWSAVIQNALTWREGGKYLPENEKTHPQTVSFINYVRKLILEEAKIKRS